MTQSLEVIWSFKKSEDKARTRIVIEKPPSTPETWEKAVAVARKSSIGKIEDSVIIVCSLFSSSDEEPLGMDGLFVILFHPDMSSLMLRLTGRGRRH